MIRRTSRRLSRTARRAAEVRAWEAELFRLNEELGVELANETRPAARAQVCLVWGRLSAEAMIGHAAAGGGDLASWDGAAQRIVDLLRNAVTQAVPALMAEEAPDLASEAVDGLLDVVLAAVRDDGTPLAAALPTLCAVLSWHVAVFDATARVDAQALRRLAILAPYESARRLASILGGPIGLVVEAWASRAIARTVRVAELVVDAAGSRSAPYRRRGPPSSLRRARHVVGTSPNAPPTSSDQGALRGPLCARGRSRRRTVPI